VPGPSYEYVTPYEEGFEMLLDHAPLEALYRVFDRFFITLPMIHHDTVMSVVQSLDEDVRRDVLLLETRWPGTVIGAMKVAKANGTELTYGAIWDQAYELAVQSLGDVIEDLDELMCVLETGIESSYPAGIHDAFHEYMEGRKSKEELVDYMLGRTVE
jgi:hypothetical protein